MVAPAQRGSITGPVMKYFSQRPNELIYIDDVVKELGLERRQILNALAGRRFAGDPIVTVVSGQAYRWSTSPVIEKEKAEVPEVPAPKAASVDMFLMKQIGKLANGELILQDEDTQILYRATLLK